MEQQLRFDRPASIFEEALPLGNGRLGAMVYGGTTTEKISVNEDTLWSGFPSVKDRPNAYQNLTSIRNKIDCHMLGEATQEIHERFLGEFTESYQPLGTILLNFLPGNISDYERILHLDTAKAEVSYRQDGVKISREYFCSNPHQVLAIRLSAQKESSLCLTINFDSPNSHQCVCQDNVLSLIGNVPAHVEPSYFPSDNPITAQIDGQRGMGFALSITALQKGGLMYANNNSLRLENCDEIVLLVATSTGFIGYDKKPQVDPLIALSKTLHTLNFAHNEGWEALKNAHQKDYQKLYSKVNLDLMATPNKNSIPNRLADISKGKEDRGLVELLFQFGRYLLISCSREGTQPANLQGIWNEEIRPPWSSNYTLNINTQMNYWPAESCGLSECHIPLFDMLKELSVTGAETAKNEYGMRGWVCHHNTDLWRQTAPVGVREENPVTYAFWPMGAVWTSIHLWEHYQFTLDNKFLRGTAFPILRGAAQFMLDYLICDESGQYLTSPSTSPENTFILNGEIFSVYKMSTMDLFLLRELFAICISCCNLLGLEPQFRIACETILAGLPSPNVNADGRLLEWYEDFEEVDPNHRHVSHLFGLFPGSQKIEPELAASCKKSLERRGDEGTGWSLAWKANLWARLGDGAHAYCLILRMLRLTESRGINMHGGGGVYPNLFCAHPPFQIDGNFGITSAIAELFVQSQGDVIEILPALPPQLPNGCCRGLRARGGIEVSVSWNEGVLTECTLKATTDTTIHIRYHNLNKDISLKSGQTILLNDMLEVSKEEIANDKSR